MTEHILKKLTVNGADAQVESAIRDGNGNVISTYYLPKVDYYVGDLKVSTSSSTTQSPIFASVTATTFTGNLTGTASVATKIGTTTIGSTTQPIYLNAGTPTTVTSIPWSMVTNPDLTPTLSSDGTLTF
jgi:hypothetical protein